MTVWSTARCHPLRPFLFVSSSRDNTVRQWRLDDVVKQLVAQVAVIDPGSMSPRREFCHSAAPPSPFSRRFNTDGEGMSAK